MEEKRPSMEDLSFLNFPKVSQEVVLSVMFGLIALVLLVAFARQLRVWLANRGLVEDRKANLERVSRESKQPKYARDLLNRLAALSPIKSGAKLAQDAAAFEAAVERLYEQTPEAALQDEMDAVSRLRRAYHLNVMNPTLHLVSTRQLLPDLPLRLISKASGETLDVYCSLLDVNEAFLLVDLPSDWNIQRVLRENPNVQLVYWREQEGETVFHTTLEFVPSAAMPLVRAKHVTRSEEGSQRADFRLTVDFPLIWRYVEREKIGKVKAAAGQQLDVKQGEGRMLDFSFGGASFECREPLAPGGLAQVQFKIREDPVHMMLEVVAQSQTGEGVWVHRGRIRGMTQETRNRIFNYLSREQMVRLREREVIRRKPGEAEPA